MAKNKEDYYSILGVSSTASEAELKTAYRRMAMKYHPDRNPGNKEAEEKFKQLNEAFEVLSDSQKRQLYDTYGPEGVQAGGGFSGAGGFGGFGGGGFGGFDGVDFGGGGGGFADIFESFFGGGGRRGGGRARKSSSSRGSDIETTIVLTFEEAAFGVTKELEITKPERCDKCEGKGAEPGSPIINCKACGGTGEVRTVKNTILGQMVTSHVCGECDGVGKVPEKKCTKCHGSTRMRASEHVKVRIPMGVDRGTVIRVTGKGEAGMGGGAYGDLYVHIDLRAHPKFARNDLDVYSDKELSIASAVLGDEVQIETLHGNVKLKIPAGTQSETVFKIAGKGIEREEGVSASGHGQGNHYVKVHVKIPQKLSREEKEAFEKLKTLGGGSGNASGSSSEKKGWL
ncbi:MAG: molecular chaperone DnaJ [Candidatus Omnitrophota bacterium]